MFIDVNIEKYKLKAFQKRIQSRNGTIQEFFKRLFIYLLSLFAIFWGSSVVKRNEILLPNALNILIECHRLKTVLHTFNEI